MEKLAIQGGSACVTLPIPAWPPPAWPEVREALERSLDDGSWGQYHGRTVAEFVNAFSSFTNQPHVWPCSSGTIAVELGLRGVGVRPGQEVILAGYDFPGNFRAIEHIGARPHLIDIVENGYVIDPGRLPGAITKNTGAVIVSHLHGQLADVVEICRICESHRIPVVEDACQVPGAFINGVPAGATGDVGVFSFGGSKLLTAGRGGAVVTGNEEVLQRIRISAERGNDAYPLSALQAAVLLPQLKMLDRLNQQRNQAATKLIQAIRSLPMFDVLDMDARNRPAYFKFPVRLAAEHDRESVMAAFSAEGFPLFEGFRGFAKRSLRRCHKSGSLDNAIQAASRTLLLHHPVLLADDDLIDQVILAFRKIQHAL